MLNEKTMTRDEQAENFEYCRHIAEELRACYEGRGEENEDGEPGSLWDYFADALDIEYTVTSGLEYSGVKVYVTLGGPTCWIDTDRGAVCLTWGGKSAECYLCSDLVEAIDDIFAEYYNAALDARR